MEEIPLDVLIELLKIVILKWPVDAITHYGKHRLVRLDSRDKIKKRKYKEAIQDRLKNKDHVLMAIYQNKEISQHLLSLLELINPDIIEYTINLFESKYGLNEKIVKDILWDCSRKLLQHPRASEFEDEIGLFKQKALNAILQNPEVWMERCKKPHPGDCLSYSYRILGQSLALQENWLGAFESFSKAVKESKNDKEKAKSLRELGKILFDLGRYKESIRNLIKSIILAKEYKELEEDRIGAEGLLAWIAMYRGHLAYTEKIFIKHENYHFLGRVYYEMGKYEKALKMLEIEKNRKERLHRCGYISNENYLRPVGFDLRWKALCLSRLGENSEAYYFWEQSKDKFQNHFSYAHLLLDKGVWAIQFGKPIFAVEQFESAIDIWKSLGYLKGYLENTLYLGKAWLKLKDYKRALSAFKTVIDKSKPMGINRLSTEANSLMEMIKVNYGEKKFTGTLKDIEP